MAKRLDLDHYYKDLDVELDLVEGVALWNKFSYVEGLSASTETTLASFNSLCTFKTAAEQLTLTSTSTADTSAGTGATQVYLYALNSDYEDVGVSTNLKPYQYPSEIITLNGTTGVDTSGSYLAVERCAVGICGTGQTNAGTISVVGKTSGATYAQIPIGSGVTQQSMHFTPSGYTSYFENTIKLFAVRPSGGASARVTFRIMYYDGVLNSIYEIDRFIVNTAVQNGVVLDNMHSGPYREKSAIYVQVNSDTANAFAFARMKGSIVKNTTYAESAYTYTG